MPYGSTALRLVQDRCPRALHYRESGAAAPRDVYSVGTACHAVLDALQQARGSADDEIDTDRAARIADDVRAALIAGGRMWRGTPEPPLRPDDVASGVMLALAWHAAHGTIPGAVSELGLGLAPDGRGGLVAVAYDDTPRDGYRTALDLVWIAHEEGDDGAEPRVTVVSRDYKTAWSAGAHTLDTEQMRTQAILAIEWARRQGIDPDAVRIEIGAVRTRQVHSLEIDVSDPLLAAWRADLAATLRGLDGQRQQWGGERPAVPSYRCGGCEYLHACMDGSKWLSERVEHPADMAERYVAATEYRRRLGDALRVMLDESDPVQVGSKRVGHCAITTTHLRDDAPRAIVQRWALGGGEWSEDMAAGLVRAAKMGAAQAKSIATAIVPGRTKAANAERRELVEAWTGTETAVRFDIHAAAADDEAGAA